MHSQGGPWERVKGTAARGRSARSWASILSRDLENSLKLRHTMNFRIGDLLCR